MSDEMRERELQEAIQAGEQALKSLRAAAEKLDSAKKWGIFDMLGGGFLASLVKNSKMDQAAADMTSARYDLQRFQRELKDVCVTADMQLEVSDFLTFADFFFDGFVADYLVQSRIEEARAKVDRAIALVDGALRELRRRG